mmetsp:Transcript_120601/g.213314  ORF Transcript_120601/g.213314 Transcript_120601/m.213314 type:complete len:282 (+) Transcript_120601:239-1084(+)
MRCVRSSSRLARDAKWPSIKAFRKPSTSLTDGMPGTASRSSASDHSRRTVKSSSRLSTRAGNCFDGKWSRSAALSRLDACKRFIALSSSPGRAARRRTTSASSASCRQSIATAVAQHSFSITMSRRSCEGRHERAFIADANASSVFLRRLPLKSALTAGSSRGLLLQRVSRRGSRELLSLTEAATLVAINVCSVNAGRDHFTATAALAFEELLAMQTVVPLAVAISIRPVVKALLPFLVNGTRPEATRMPYRVSRTDRCSEAAPSSPASPSPAAAGAHSTR